MAERDALRVEDGGQDQTDRADHRHVLLEPAVGALVDELGDEAAGDEQTADHRAVEARDAAEVDERERGERSEEAVGLRLDRSEAVALQHSGESGDGCGDGEAEQLRAGDVDAGGRGGALVGPHGEEAPPGRPAAQARRRRER